MRRSILLTVFAVIAAFSAACSETGVLNKPVTTPTSTPVTVASPAPTSSPSATVSPSPAKDEKKSDEKKTDDKKADLKASPTTPPAAKTPEKK
jgi:hypothetical protein